PKRMYEREMAFILILNGISYIRLDDFADIYSVKIHIGVVLGKNLLVNKGLFIHLLGKQLSANQNEVRLLEGNCRVDELWSDAGFDRLVVLSSGNTSAERKGVAVAVREKGK